ncbi:MAG TPA: metallopeptidase family protein [Mycobacteriales bacterium]
MPASAGPVPFPRRRDRRGRGPRGPLTPPDLPLRRSKADAFDELVLDAVEHLDVRWSAELDDVEFAVEPVPPDDLPSADGDLVALARAEPAVRGRPARVVVYRRPLEARGRDPEDLADLVLDVVVHEVARLLGLPPEIVDPEGHPPD